MMFDVVYPFMVGLLGSLHCLGMCGPLVLAYSLNLSADARAKAPWRRGLSHHIAFHGGRVLTYAILGTLAATITSGAALAPFFKNFRGIASMAAGAMILLFGLALMRIVPLSFSAPALVSPGHVFMGRMVTSDTLRSKWFLGMGAGCLPCMLPWAMLVNAASTGTLPGGFLVMALFGLGTVPALLFAGFSVSLLSLRIRMFGGHIAGCSVMLMGAILLWKGVKHFF